MSEGEWVSECVRARTCMYVGREMEKRRVNSQELLWCGCEQQQQHPPTHTHTYTHRETHTPGLRMMVVVSVLQMP